MTFQNYLYEKILKLLGDENKEILDILKNKTDFFVTSASEKNHLSFEGGLAIHSYNVMKNIKQELINKNWNISLNSALKCALLHDLCKTNYYFKQPDGSFKPDYTKIGHGDRSIKLAKKLGIKLTEQEKALIEFHMGPFAPLGTLHKIDKIDSLDEAKNRMQNIKSYQTRYSEAVAKYPEILAIYSADHLASIKELKVTQDIIQKDYENWKKNIKIK